jgi:hypothetical protein
MRRQRMLGYMGDGTPSEADVLSQAFNLANQLRTANQRILALENAVMQSPDVALAIGRDVIQARQQYTGLVSKFIFAYQSVTGSVPDGLSALPVGTIIAAAAVFVVVVSGLIALSDYLGTIEANQQAALSAARTRQSLAAQAAAAQAASADAAARGDTATAQQQAQIAADANAALNNTDQNPGGTGMADFVKNNALLIGGALALVVLLKD